MRESMYVVFLLAICLAARAGFAKSNEETYELQERCGQAAEKRFKSDWGNGVIDTQYGQDMATCENHYSSTLNKCFYLKIVSSIHTRERNISHHMGLLDLHENKEWGRFFQSAGESQPIFCYVGHSICHSQDEWMNLARPFMAD
jgi:hypothetical protein